MNYLNLIDVYKTLPLKWQNTRAFQVLMVYLQGGL